MKFILSLILSLPFSLYPQTDFGKAQQLFAKQQFAEAKVLFESDLKQNPKHTEAIEFLGDTNSHLQKWEAAVSCYEQLKNSHPKNAEYQYKYGGALAMVAKDAYKLKAFSMIGDIELAFQKAIANNPKHIEARWALVELYLQLPGIVGGSEEKATRYAHELAQLSTVDGYLSKGRIAEYFERYPTAEQYYRKAFEVGNSKTTCQKLADLYKNKMHQPEKAKAVWDNYNKTKG